MWQGIQAITDYKPTSTYPPTADPSLPGELNYFYARFDRDNQETPIKSALSADLQPLTLTPSEVRTVLSRTNARKAAGPDGIPGRVLRNCAEQLTTVLTDIFNLSLAQAVVPACLKTTSIVPVPKHSSATSLNDFRPVALTPIIMNPPTMGKIIFYEGRNFQGRHWECNSDCMDTYRHFNCCNSIRVTGGHWVNYEKPNYMGYQYIMGPGEYPDYHSWMGYNNCIRSCQMFPPYRGAYRMRIWNRPEMMGHMMEFMEDCPNVYERFRYRDIFSCNIMEGYWIFYEHPNYRGRQYFLRPGEYRACGDWGCHNPMVGSFRRMRSGL
ncbi:gamma-crystallin M2-like [Polymixia lowei]